METLLNVGASGTTPITAMKLVLPAVHIRGGVDENATQLSVDPFCPFAADTPWN